MNQRPSVGIKLLRQVKNAVVPKERKALRIRGGLNRGLRMNLRLRHQTQLLLGLYETETFPFFRKLQNHVASGIDVGANEGYYTLFFALRSSANNVIAFEPLEWLDEIIHGNLTLNSPDPNTAVTVIPKLVGASVTSDTTALDAYRGDIALPCFIKVDVDGPEADVLRGAEELLATNASYWLIETHSESAEDECIEILKTANYFTEIIPNARWRRILPENRHAPHNRWLYAAPNSALSPE